MINGVWKFLAVIFRFPSLLVRKEQHFDTLWKLFFSRRFFFLQRRYRLSDDESNENILKWEITWHAVSGSFDAVKIGNLEAAVNKTMSLLRGRGGSSIMYQKTVLRAIKMLAKFLFLQARRHLVNWRLSRKACRSIDGNMACRSAPWTFLPRWQRRTLVKKKFDRINLTFVQLFQAKCADKVLGMEFPEHGGDATSGDGLRATSA